MATQPFNRCLLEEYLELEDTLGCRTEFHDGDILPAEAATYNHSRLSQRIGSLLQTALPNCSVSDSSLNLYIAAVNRVLHPDVTVVCGEPNFVKPDCIENPAILVEVLSPATNNYDYGAKRAHYFNLLSLQHYLLVSQTETTVGHYERSGAAWIYRDLRVDVTIVLGKVEVPVAAIYSGMLP